MCNVDISLGGQIFNTEFTVLPPSTQDIILGIDFLQLCGTNVACRTENSVSSALLEESSQQEPVLCVSEDTNVPALSTMRVSVVCSSSISTSFDVAVEPVHRNCLKKNVLFPHCMALVTN